MRNVEWIEGEPDELRVGMLVEPDDGPLFLVGGYQDSKPVPVKGGIRRWAWLIKGHEISWLQAIGKAHKAKGTT